MPIYTYRNQYGKEKEFLKPYPPPKTIYEGEEFQAETVQWCLCTSPQPISIAGHVKLPTGDEQIKRGYYDFECSGKPWNGPFTKAQTKHILEGGQVT